VQRRKYSYSVREVEVKKFIEGNECIREFLNKYNGQSLYEKSQGLVRFFTWLRRVKGIELSPSQFLDLHLKRRSSESVEQRRWALKLVLEFSRDNPDLTGKAQSYIYAQFFLPMKVFCDYNEAPLTQVKGFFPKRGRRKYPENPFTAQKIRQVLAALSQRERAVCMVELQSGQSIHQVLHDVNGQADYIIREITAGKQRIRLDFTERKGNGFAYFSYISVDAIQEIRKWLPIREKILWGNNVENKYLFVTNTGRQLVPKLFHNNIRLALNTAKIRKGPLSIRSHGLRKFFEQESSPPERNISKSYISFMMGHSGGNGSDNKLDIVGGVYDHAPRVYPQAVEREYMKLEPYLNIYSSQSTLNEDKQRFFAKLANVLEQYPEKEDKFFQFLENL